jgi:site-specific recombinase XerD
LIHNLKLPLSVVQEVAGHINPSTTVIYTQPTEIEKSEALKAVEYAQ